MPVTGPAPILLFLDIMSRESPASHSFITFTFIESGSGYPAHLLNQYLYNFLYLTFDLMGFDLNI
jgi:hypothetical protein